MNSKTEEWRQGWGMGSGQNEETREVGSSGSDTSSGIFLCEEVLVVVSVSVVRKSVPTLPEHRNLVWSDGPTGRMIQQESQSYLSDDTSRPAGLWEKNYL